MSSRDSDIRRRVEEIFDAALDVPADERAAFVRERTRAEPDVAREVEALLAAAGREGILDRPAPVPPVPRAPPAGTHDLRSRLQAGLGDRYRIVAELGRGGMAVVFLAWERKHDRRVVLKALRPEVAVLYGADRFLHEVRLASRLSHPHIVGLIDSGRVDGLLYYVMPHVEGETLRDRLDREGALPLDQALSLLGDVAAALEYAHDEGVVHRDLKPGNVLCAGDHAYLMDFGVAKSILALDAAVEPTVTGMAIGTPRYMAPEQRAGGGDVDERADLFAWGRLACEVLTGEAPRDDAGDVEGGATATAIREARPEVPRELAALVARCVARERGDRPRDAGSLRAVLDRLATPVAAGSRRSSWTRGAVLALAGGAAAAAAWFGLARPGGGPAAAEGGAGLPLGLEGPVAVAEFRNETGDSSLAVLGRLAGDWVTQGLQEAGVLAVVPWPTALDASRRAGGEAGSGTPAADLVRRIREETRAGTVVTGAYYRVGDDLRFQAEVTDAVRGTVFSAPDPVVVPLDSAEVALAELRARIMGSLAVAADDRAVGVPGLVHRPPTFAAYRVFDRGLDLYLAQDYGAATEAFLQAHALDTTFHPALLYAATTAHNRGEYRRVDSLLALLSERRGRLSRYDDYRWQFLTALQASDVEAALRALGRAAELAPGSRSAYNLALVAVDANRPREALAALATLDPDRGEMRGWAQYWTVLAHARHLVGDHAGEAEAARAMRDRHPERRAAGVLEVRALAAQGDTSGIDRVLVELDALPTRTYWSQGAARVVAGEELLAHGWPDASVPYLEGALAWLAARQAEDPDYGAHRYWEASALYDLRRWEEAAAALERVMAERPDDTSARATAAAVAARLGDVEAAEAWLSEGFERDPGTRDAARARVAAVAGEGDRAVSLLSQALARGVSSFPWLHASAHHDLVLLADDPRYRRLMDGGAP